jgi:hypothetical protein
LRGRDARHFGRWLGARSDVIYPIMRTSNDAGGRKARVPTRVAVKIAAGFVEGLDRIVDTLFTLLLPGGRFSLQRGSRK